MSQFKQSKLELTWIGKENRPRLERRTELYETLGLILAITGMRSVILLQVMKR